MTSTHTGVKRRDRKECSRRDAKLAKKKKQAFSSFLSVLSVLFGNTLVSLRGDYGSTWEGDLVIRNCHWIPACGDRCWPHMIHARNDGMHDFGYPCFMPREITIDGLFVDGRNHPEGYQGMYFLTDPDAMQASPEDPTPSEERPFPYERCKKIIVRGLSTASGNFGEKLSMNIIVICIDTLRWDYLSCYGQNAWIQTPFIESHAHHATRFDAAFCGSFPTVPMRVDAYTGDVNWPRYGWKGPDVHQRTLPQVLREHGYYTGLVLDTRNNVGAGLHEFYDEYVLIKKPPTNTTKPEDIVFPFPPENARQHGRGYARDMADTAHYRHEMDWFVARTMLSDCQWLEQNRHRDRFFLWVDTFEPHEVWRAPSHYTDLYSPEYQGIDYAYPNYGTTDIYQPHEIERLRARYAAEVTLTDRWVGHLLYQIKVMGLFDDTVVILTSDHGMYLGEHGLMGKHTVDYSKPWPLLDEVARVPLLVWSPFQDAVESNQALVQPADLFPTILDLCDIPSEAPYGRSWLPVLMGEQTEHWQQIYTSYFSWEGAGKIDYLRALITVTTYEWSLVLGPSPHTPQLFDRAHDSRQLHNCASEHPRVVEELRQRVATFMLEQGASPDYVRCFTGAAKEAK